MSGHSLLDKPFGNRASPSGIARAHHVLIARLPYVSSLTSCMVGQIERAQAQDSRSHVASWLQVPFDVLQDATMVDGRDVLPLQVAHGA